MPLNWPQNQDYLNPGVWGLYGFLYDLQLSNLVSDKAASLVFHIQTSSLGRHAVSCDVMSKACSITLASTGLRGGHASRRERGIPAS